MQLLIRIASIAFLVVLLPLAVLAHSAMDRFWGEVPVDMLISGDVLVVRTLVVPEDVTLTVEPGTVVRFDAAGEGDNRIVVRGTLVAVGTGKEPIRFIPKDEDGKWYGIEFAPGAAGMLEHCIIEGSASGIVTGGSGVNTLNVEVR